MSALLEEFQHEFEMQQTRRLRDRVFWYCAATCGFYAFLVLVRLVWMVYDAQDLLADIGGLKWREIVQWVIPLLASGFTMAYALIEARDARANERDREEHLRRVSTFIAISGIVSSVNIFALGVLTEGGLRLGFLALQQVLFILFFHATASMFLPWTWRESLRPFLPMYLINAVGLAALWVIRRDSFTVFDLLFLLVYAVMSIGAVMPGIGIGYWRHNRFAQEFTFKAVAGRYGEMRRELSGAQRIHEQLFPRPEVRGSVRFDYRYEPMRLIGGDYLYARFITTDDRLEPQLLCLLLDVTGHGIPAALTVNRLYGEIERLVAEDPKISPTGVLRALNRYAFLTLSDHSLFVTAVAFRLDHATGRLHYANAGHPPAFHRSGGVVRELEPTAMVLGVAKDLDVEVEDAWVPLGEGDAVIAYTDGAMETRDKAGRMFNVDGLKGAIIAAVGETPVCHQLLAAVTRHRFGPLTDDTLIVEIGRIAVPAAPPITSHTNGHSPSPVSVSPSPVSEPANTSAT
ncbi:MAG: PP2C family protein-serine/threonine phosphatase [Phycisphaerales bacterium]